MPCVPSSRCSPSHKPCGKLPTGFQPQVLTAVPHQLLLRPSIVMTLNSNLVPNHTLAQKKNRGHIKKNNLSAICPPAGQLNRNRTPAGYSGHWLFDRLQGFRQPSSLTWGKVDRPQCTTTEVFPSVEPLGSAVCWSTESELHLRQPTGTIAT